MGYDRGEVLARIPLAGLCDELLGPHHGRGRAARWPCPDPNHGPQTGRTPPVTVFQPRSGAERWHCHACGSGGTAIDLVMVSQGVGFLDALELLARRAGVGAEPWQPTPRPPAPVRPTPPAATRPSPALENYVSACEAWLWAPGGAPMRRWVAGRGLGEDVLRVNRVGADPGPRALPREQGLPRGGPAVVLPIFDGCGRVVYLQARYLRPNGRKYDNPSSDIVPGSPRLGDVRVPGPTIDPKLVLVCEGVPDALTVVQAGYRAVAVLGAGLPDERLAAHLISRHPEERLLVAFDADHRGRAGSERLTELLTQAGAGDRVDTLTVPEAFGDLNGWAQAAGEGFAGELGAAIHQTTPALAEVSATHSQKEVAMTHDHGPADPPDLRSELVPSNPGAPELDDLLETLAYQHLLLDDRSAVTHNLEEIVGVLEAWRSGGTEPAALDSHGEVIDALEKIAYHHLLADDQGNGLGAIDKVAEALDHWVDLPAPGPAREVPGTSIASQNDLDLPASLLPATPGLTLDAGLDL